MHLDILPPSKMVQLQSDMPQLYQLIAIENLSLKSTAIIAIKIWS